MSTLNNKLDYLDETKQLIKQAIIDKGQEVSDEDTFRSYVDKISDIETGSSTQDATASSNDILYPETAYISNGKVTGNIMPTYSSNTTLSQINTIIRSLSYSLLDINYNAKIAIVSDEDYKFNFCNIVNNEIDYENSTYITLNDFEEGMDGTYTFSKCCTNFDKNTNDLYLYLLFTFQNTLKVFCYTYNIKTKSSKYIDTYELTIDDANNSLVLNMMIRPNYPNQAIVFCGYTSITALGSYLTTIFLQFNTVALELQKIEDTISTSVNQYAAKVESCYFTSNGEYLCINARTGTLSGITQNGVIYHCVNNFLESIIDSTQYVTLFENGNYVAYNQSTRNHCLFNVNGDVLYSYSGNLGEISTEQLTYTNKCILGNYLFGFAYPNDFINPGEPFKLYCCKLNEDYTITKEQEIDVGSRVLFNCYNAILYDNKNTRNFDGYIDETEKEIISLNRNNINYYSTKDADATVNDVINGKIFYNKDGKQIGVGEFGSFIDVDLSYINSSITISGDIKNLIGAHPAASIKEEDVTKLKINDIIVAPIMMAETGAEIIDLKCNCVCKITSILNDSSIIMEVLAVDINTEDGTATSEDIVEGKIAYVDNKRVHGIAKLGIDTSDATAMATDILAPKTAYVNGEKIIGAIEPVYGDYTAQLSSNIFKDSVVLSDINTEYKIGIKNTSSKLSVYFLSDSANPVLKSSISFSTSDAVANVSVFAAEVTTIGEDTFIRTFTAGRNTSTKIYKIYTCLINTKTYEIQSDSLQVASFTLPGYATMFTASPPVIAAMPKTTDRCVAAFYSSQSQICHTWIKMCKVVNEVATIKDITKVNHASNNYGPNTIWGTIQFTSTGEYLMVYTRTYGDYNSTHMAFLAYSSTKFDSFTTKISKGSAGNDSSITKILNDEYIVQSNKIYNISNLTYTNKTIPITPAHESLFFSMGDIIIYVPRADSTTFKIYKYDADSISLTFQSEVTEVSSYSLRYHWRRYFILY